MKKSLIVFLTVLLVSVMTLGVALVPSFPGSEESNHQLSIPPQVWENNTKLEVSERPGSEESNHQLSIPPQVWENNTKLIEVSERLVLADLAAAGIPLAGFYVDAWTCTIYVGLTEIKDEYTEPIKAIVNEVEGVNLAFFKARFTEAELRSLQRKIEEAFMKDETLKKDEAGIPFLTMIGVDIKDNELMVGFREIRPQYIEAIRKVVGTEVPIEFVEGVLIEEEIYNKV